ncbi:pantetheine-phosphate adenylyltransferase [Flavobacteriaceae bacterium TK19130]|nr:pantetheine-phosphate adenylyltransferase [Thermobacterium salinum]
MAQRAVFPGSFDPITIGHIDIIERALPLFDEVIIAIGVNAAKKYRWSLEERKRFIEQAFKDVAEVRVMTYEGLTTDFCKNIEADYIVRGVRNSNDFIYEQTIAQANKENFGIESIFLAASPKVAYISSSIVRDIERNGGDYSKLVPKSVP